MNNNASKEVRNLKLHKAWLKVDINPLSLTFKIKGGIEWKAEPKTPPKKKKELRKKQS